jgi:lycopene cyclase domain-containing protein
VTYFGFLVGFLSVPIALLAFLIWRDRRRGVTTPHALRNISGWWAIGCHILIAVAYTTPWDNYLVATGVWWYDPSLVSGITLGWVPLEEYLFFVLQTILTGMWLLWLAPRLPRRLDRRPWPGVRAAAVLAILPLWLASVALLLAGAARTGYLALILVWALPPIMLQAGFGGDILLRYRPLVLAGIAVPWLYLCAADTLALRAGTWTISPHKTLGLDVLPDLPLEEAVFFLMTNTLLVFGIVLALAEESRERLEGWLEVRAYRRGEG